MHHIARASLAVLIAMGFSAPSAVFGGWDDGVAAFKAGHYRQASEHFADFIGGNPGAPQGHYMLGLSLLQEKRLLESLGPFEDALRLAPTDTSYRLAFAQAQARAHRANGAVTTLMGQDLASLPADQRQTFDHLLARAATESSDGETAHKALKAVLKVHADEPSLWLAMAKVERRRNAPEADFNALAKAFALNAQADVGRRAVETAFDLAKATSDEARRSWYFEASKIAESLATSQPTAEHALLAGGALMGAQEISAATPWFQLAASLQDDNALPHYYLAQCALAESKGSEALAHLEAAARRSPTGKVAEEILLVKGAALRQTEAFEEAAAVYRQAGLMDEVAEMEALAETQRKNADWDLERRRCQSKQQEIRELMVDSEDLRGTAAWRELEAVHDQMLAECSSYFEAPA